MKLTFEEAILAIRETQLIAHSHSNGADWLECPFCGEQHDVKGYASNETWYPGHFFKHRSGCAMERAWENE